MTNQKYHYPPDLFQLLVAAIPRLCRSKRDVITFFRGAGVEHAMSADLYAQVSKDRNAVTKAEITRTILTRLNEAGDRALGPRRELLKRVVEFEDFTACWPDDRLEAQGLVANIRNVINVKDSFTRMQLEREAEVRRHRESARNEAEILRQKRERLNSIRQDLYKLFSLDNAQQRGLLLEPTMNGLFREAGVLVKEAFRRESTRGKGPIEQVDGAIELDGNVYLVELKWLKTPVDVEDISRHIVRVMNRGDCRGLFISYSGYTNAAIEICRESFSHTSITLFTLKEFVLQLENEAGITAFLREKIRNSIADREPFKEMLG